MIVQVALIVAAVVSLFSPYPAAALMFAFLLFFS